VGWTSADGCPVLKSYVGLSVSGQRRFICALALSRLLWSYFCYVFSCICECLSLCNALNYEYLDLEHSCLVRRYVFGISRSNSNIKFIGVKVRVIGAKSVSMYSVCGWSVFDWKAILLDLLASWQTYLFTIKKLIAFVWTQIIQV